MHSWRAIARIPIVMVAGCVLFPLTSAAKPRDAQPIALGQQRPMVAVWEASQGWGSTPHLRIAIWSDGRVLFVSNTRRWGAPLREGRISRARVAELARAIQATGVFELSQPEFAGVPDGPVDKMLIEFGNRRTVLVWDEVESPHYGDNINPTPGYLKLKACWKAVNRLALDARPKESRTVKGAFEPPRSWYQAPKPR